jgi:hypothetical protein
MTRQFVALVVALLIAVPSFAQQKNDPAAPAPGNVTLSLDEYNRLLALANRPAKKTDSPPQPYLLKRADLKFRVNNDDVLGSIQFEGETLSANTTIIPLTNGMTVLDAHHGAKPLPLLLENGVHSAILPGESEFAVSLDAGLPLSIETGRASFMIPAPSAGSVRLALSVPGDRTNVQLNHGIITHRTSANGNTEIEATLIPGQVATVWWAKREVLAQIVPREVRFLSDVKSLVSVSESDLQIAALADINVVQGDADQFSVAIPNGFEVTAVNGASVESSEVQNGVLLLKVTGHGPATYQFLISLERPLKDSNAAAPILAFQGAQRETGEMLVEGQGTIELSAKESGGLKRLDIKEVNPYLRALSRYSLQAAFRYHRQPGESPALALDWTRFPDSSVLSAIAEHATVTTLVTSEGKSLTEVKLTLKNQAQPFLKVELPAGASILTAEVAGEKVKPVQGPDGNRVPLLRTGFRPAGAYTVSFVFLHSGTPFAKKGGSDIALPKMDVPISILEWELFLPDQFKVKDFSGDAISASLVPAEYQTYVYAGGPDQAGIIGGTAAGVSGAVVDNNLPMNGRNFTELTSLAPGVALAPGQLSGLVIDSSGAVISNARVQVRNTATGSTMTTNTTAEGYWLVTGLSSGTYQVTASSPGFQSLSVSIPYDASRPHAYRFTLNVGALAQTVEVTSSMLVETGASSVGSSKKQKRDKGAAPMALPPPPQASANVFNLQQRVAGVLPVAVDVPRAGTSYRFLRPLVVNEETKLAFTYKSR